MNWADILVDPQLQDLPFKVETNQYGQIVMTPASNEHGDLQVQLAILLTQYAGSGRASVECSVQTENGVKVADVAWKSDNFLSQHTGENPYQAAPEICIEVLSPSNSRAEMEAKRRLYLAAGALEVWLCDALEEGQPVRVTCYDASGELTQSKLVPEFPREVSL